MQADSTTQFDFGKKAPIQNEYVRFDKLSALVIDDISSMRHAIRMQLQSIGMNIISQATSAQDALMRIDTRPFDLILCDYNLNQSSSGQHFLEYLRNEHILSATTIFVMLTAEVEYSFVANAAEFSPDDYILKPCSEKKLRTRLERLIDRRTYLLPVLNALDAKNYDKAVIECNKLLVSSPEERRVMDILKRKAEAQSMLNNHAQVLETYTLAASIRGETPWVMLGAARAHYALGDLPQALEIAGRLVEKNKNYVAAYELLADIKLELSDYDGAFTLLNLSSDILPSAQRFRSVAEAAFLSGKLEDAKTKSQDAIKLSNGSMVERSGDYLLLAQTLVDMGDHDAAIQALEKNAKKYGDEGLFGVAKNAILAQAYFDSGDIEKSKKLLARSNSLFGNRKDSFVSTALGKAALRVGDVILGMKLLTQAVQYSGKDDKRIARHVTKSMVDTGFSDKVNDVIDGGKKRILLLVDDTKKLMKKLNFSEAHLKVEEALGIHEENIEALMAAAQLQLLWLTHEGMNTVVMNRAKLYLSKLDKLVPNDPKVMQFYKYFNETVNNSTVSR